MASLARDLRKVLERRVGEARSIAEAGARKALEQLGVGEATAPRHLSKEEEALRRRLRAHGRQLGDKRATSGEQGIDRLVGEVAYEHWHRMLFARFLAENDLLIEPVGSPLPLEFVQELAREQSVDWLELAAGYAQRMLPQIFRPEDPALSVPLPPETRSELEDLLKGLPAAVFQADDSLGWVYQFWQAEQKKRINESGVKIGADELPAVTQLFTEDYMVLFLLHNTLGAWWAGKALAANPDLAATAADEAALRAACAPDGIELTYLRFVRDTDDDGTQGPWRPAAGTFDGWPKAAKDITLLDPCMGSGHFLVFALPILVAFRMAEEGLSREAAVEAVLHDNIHGLEIDPRCTQIAAFNLAFAAWRMVGYRPLPALNLACSGLSIGVTKSEWLRLGERAASVADPGAKTDLLGTETTLLNAGVDARVYTGLERMYDTFARAPWLGSLIDPRRAGADIFAADFDAMEPFLRRALADGGDDLAELAVAAQGLARASNMLSRRYCLVATNVPYLHSAKQSEYLREYCSAFFPDAESELAAVFMDRATSLVSDKGLAAFVSPQNWFSLVTYKSFRLRFLRNLGWRVVVFLGPAAFQEMNWWAANTGLSISSKEKPKSKNVFAAFNTSQTKDVLVKSEILSSGIVSFRDQAAQILNPDHTVFVDDVNSDRLLGAHASALQGISPGDSGRVIRTFWEISSVGAHWRVSQSNTLETEYYGGRSYVIDWDTVNSGSSSAAVRGRGAWGRAGVAVGQMRQLPATLYSGDFFTNSSPVIIPNNDQDLSAIWAFCESPEFSEQLKKINPKSSVDNGYLAKIPFDVVYWREVAAKKYPNGLPRPNSDDPTQWLFHGHPRDAKQPLHVAVARLLGYRWPRQTGSSFMDCPAITEPDGLERHADADGIVCLSALKGEAPAAQRLGALLSAAFGANWSPARLSALLTEVGFAGKSLDDWLRDGFFEQHCALFHQRPFVWHVWDGRADGFHALVNYHRLAGPDGEGRRTLEKLIYTYLGDWIDGQRDAERRGVAGAEGRLAAALHLKAELEKIRDGEPPYDIFVRWKPLHRQAIGWEPDIDDGVRQNIRPFLTARPLPTGRRGDPCILRVRPKGSEFDYTAKPDRGKEPMRDKADYPWFWTWDGRTQDFPGGAEFDGSRWNGLHYSNEPKRAARERHATKGDIA
jgi:hypothetical protein